jgi:hypothetical protein
MDKWFNEAKVLEAELTTLRTQVESLRRERKQLEAIKHHMDYCRGLLKCPSDDVLSESIKTLIDERDQARAACAVKHHALQTVWDEDEMGFITTDGSDVKECVKCGGQTGDYGFIAHRDGCIQDPIENAIKDNPGQPLLDQLHAYQSGVVEAVKALEYCEKFTQQATYGEIFDLNLTHKALATLRPLVTPKEVGK